MKIVFLSDRIYAYATGDPAVAGGAERQQWLLSRALATAGWQVTCGIRDGLGPGQRATIEGVEFLGLDRHQFYLSLHRFLSSEKPAWLYWRGAEHLWGPVVEIARLSSTRTIFAAAFDTDVQPSRALTRRRAWWPLYAWGLQRTDRIFVQHQGQLSQLHAVWRSKATVVPGIAGEIPAIRCHSARETYIAWVGMLREPKRPDILVRIARDLPAERFVVCGGPTTHRSPTGYSQRIMNELRQLPNVQFLGQVAPETAMRTIADAAVLLSTSDEEGFPNTFLQAWSSGTPVVTLTIDPDDVIQKMGLGRVAGDVHTALADLKTLLSSPALREEMAVRGRRHVATAHSETAAVRIVEQAIRNGRQTLQSREEVGPPHTSNI